jgi:hypothetical protein
MFNQDPAPHIPTAAPASLYALLSGLIDYAGLFPPASLEMAEAVGNYAAYLEQESAWVLGRFLVPVSRLAEFERAQAELKLSARWRLSGLIGSDLDRDLALIARFNGGDAAFLDTFEAKAKTGEAADELMSRLPEGVKVYFEVEPNCPLERLASIGRLGARAKIRTGGLTPDAIPPTHAIESFISTCASTRTAFKATAGLHHPVRCLRPLSYEADAPVARMHGFLNVFLAAALAYQGTRSPAQLAAVLDTSEAERLRFDDGTARCGDAMVTTEQIRIAREQFAISFGSCSFQEPIEDLEALRLL